MEKKMLKHLGIYFSSSRRIYFVARGGARLGTVIWND
jgi:hypothetical protein